jgi:hypothetical protein
MNHSFRRKLARRRSQERGSALLIVFVFAAIIAIALFKEMPIVAFEARRQKEQTLIDRGHEYQRAVQLYYRKFGGRYPANIDMLENTNNMRFLRRRYVDPFTGKDDWRLLHAGPGGMLMDSKVQNSSINGVFGQNGNNIGGNSNATQLGTGLSGGGGARNGFGAAGDSTSTASNSSSASGGGVFGSNDSSSSSSDSDVVVPPVPKRAPVMAATGSGSGSTPSSNQLDQDPSVPLLPSQDVNAPLADTAANQPGGVAPAAPNAAAATPNSMQMMQNMFASGANQPQQQTTAAAGFNGGAGINGGAGAGAVSTTGSTGQMSGGSFAGVASKAKGTTIKKINEQTNYSLWEFWYDPTKDTSMGTMGATPNGNGGQNVQAGSQLGQPAAGFGATSTSQPATQITPAPAATDSGAGAGTTAPPSPAQPQQ